MLRAHLPGLFRGDPGWLLRAEAFAERVYELTSFLVDAMDFQPSAPPLSARVAYHDSCSGLRELGVREQPRRLLERVSGLEIAELDQPEVCCGFGGTFCVKYPEISGRLVANKTADIAATRATLVLGGDLGCLLNISGRLGRDGHDIEVRHVTEVLAGMIRGPSIGR